MTNWMDNVIEGVTQTVDLLSFMLRERSQLYGTIVHLMIQFETRELDLPEMDIFKSYGERYFVEFLPTEEGGFKVSLKMRNQDET